MNAIKSYSKAKSFVYSKRKENSSIWFAESLARLFAKKKHAYLSDFRVRCINKRKVDSLKKLTVEQNLSKSLRGFFLKWKEQSEKEALSRELYEAGQIRQQDNAYRSELRNIKEMMSNEGYDEQDINQAKVSEVSRQKGLLLKSVRRL